MVYNLNDRKYLLIIFRYLTREVYTTALATALLLLVVFSSNQLVHFLSDAAKGHYTIGMAMRLMMLQLPLLLGYFLPLGLFLGILIAYGRFYTNNEATVMFACGLSYKKFVQMTLLMASFTFLVVSIFTIWIKPILELSLERMRIEALAASPVELLTPGRFQAIHHGDIVLYVESLSSDHQRMKKVFVAKKTEGGLSWDVVSARAGYQYIDPKTQGKFLVLEDGHYYSGAPGQNEYRALQFEKFGVRLDHEALHIPEKTKLMTISSLWSHRDQNGVVAELHWRLAMPLSVFILVLLAIPLSRVRPRQGSFAKLVPALLLYMMYVNLLLVGKLWLKKGIVPGFIGLWWVHFAVLMVAIFLLLKQSGKLQRLGGLR